MKQIIDIENWERKENFNFFRHFQNPQLSITSEVECGGARQRAKAAVLAIWSRTDGFPTP